jgi:outer membrane protein assembly complex protein YaeT
MGSRRRLRPGFFWPLWMALLLILPAHRSLLAQPPSAAAPTLYLRSLEIVGMKTVSLQKIKKEMSLERPSPWPWPWRKLPVFRQEDLDYELERLKGFYRRQGFYHTQVRPEVQYLPKGEVRIKLNIQEGPWVKVTRLDVEVSGADADLAELKSKWPLKVGDRFSEEAYDDLKRLYLNYLPNHGYPQVRVEGRILLDEVKNTAQLTLKVDSGPFCRFGAVRVKDAEKLETPVAAIMEKLTFKPGEIFSLNELYKSQRRLYGTDLFMSVVLTPEEVPPQVHAIPITLEVKEKKKCTLKLGLGYGDEDKFRARLGFRYRNLGGGGRVLDVDSKYSSLGYGVQESFTNPVVFDTRFDFVNQTGARRRELPGFTDQSYSTQNRLERDLPWDMRAYLGHGLEFARPFDIPTATLIRLQGTEPEKVYRASYLLWGVRRDTVDNPTNPHRGGIINFGNELAPDFLGSELQFFQTLVEVRRYHALGETNFVIAGRLKFGLIQPMQTTSQIPIYRRFFSGGANSVRGYRLDFLGPRNVNGDPIGGNAVLEGGLEGRFPIYKKLGGVIFMDFGNVFLRARDITPGQLKYSPGVGLRYLSAIGPMGIDVGFPIHRIDPSRDKSYQIHFTVGYGF